MESSNPEPGLLATLGWVDLTALAILLVFFVLGLFRGFVWQAGRIATLLVAYLVEDEGMDVNEAVRYAEGWWPLALEAVLGRGYSLVETPVETTD